MAVIKSLTPCIESRGVTISEGYTCEMRRYSPGPRNLRDVRSASLKEMTTKEQNARKWNRRGRKTTSSTYSSYRQTFRKSFRYGWKQTAE